MENQMTREAALAEIASIEREIARLQAEPAEEQRRIAMATAAARAGGGGFITPPNQPPDFTSEELAPAALRYGVPLAVGMAAGPVVGLGALLRRPDLALSALARSGLMTGGAAALGEGGAQSVEKVTKEEDYRPEQIFGAGLRGMSPMLKNAPVINTAIAAGSGVAGGAAEGKTGGLEMLFEGIKSGGPTAVLQGLSSALGAGRQLLSGGIRNTQDIERIAPGKIRATFSQAFPEYAGLESRVASQTGSQDLNQQLIEQSRVVANAVQRITGIPAEAHSDLVSRVAQTFGGLSPETGARLANEAQGVNDAFVAVERARSEAQKSIAQDALAEAQQSFQKAVEMETLKGGIRTSAVGPYQVVPAGTRIEEIGKKAKEVIQTEARRLYGPANAVEDVPAFDLFAGVGNEKSFADRATEILDRIPNIPTSALTDVRRILARKTNAMAAPSMDPTAAITVGTPQKATFKEIQGIRNELYDFADYSGEAIGSEAQRQIRKLAGSMTGTVVDQAPKALGQEVADSINLGEEFYGATRPKLDVYGVKRAFIPQTMERGQMGKAAVEGVRSQGVLAPEFANLEDLFSTLQKRGVKDAPNMQPVIDDIRFGIIDQSIDKATGQLDLMKLAGDLNNISQQGGNGLQKLGFGNRNELNKFVQYMQNLDPAKAKGPEVVLDLLKSGTPAGFAVASRAVQMLPDLATVDSVLKSLEKQAVKGSKAAGETLLNIRAREIENILLEAGKTGPKPNLGSLIELTNPEMRQKVQLILGPKLLKTIDDIFVPGFRVMETAREAAGMAGSTVRGAAIERIGKAALEAPVQIASGEVVKPAVNVFSKMADAVGFAVMSKVLSKGAGVSGLRDRKQFYGLLKQIAEKPQAQQIQLLRRYVGEDRSE